MRRALATIVGLLLATAVLRAQAPAASAPQKAAAPAPAAAKPSAPAVTPASNTKAPAPPAAAPAAAKPTASAPAPAAPAPAATTPAPAAAQPPQPEAFTYVPDGRRDPFTNLIAAGAGGGEPRAAASRRGADGAAGLAVGDISVRGIMQSRSGLIAMVQGPDNKTYIVHQGDRLLDGSIKSITTQGLVLVQDVNDPLSLVKQREVSKLLRSLEGVK